MLIGELSRKSGFTRDTIRYYEKMGLLSIGNTIRRDNQYKEYPDAALKRLLAIKKIKDFGFTLEEMRGIFILFEEGVLEPQRGRRFVARKIQRIDEKIETLRQTRARLMQIMEPSEEHCEIHKILEKAC